MRTKEEKKELQKFEKAEKLFFFDRFFAATILKLIPYSVKPNHVTICRFILTPIVGILTFYGTYKIALVAFLLTALTDAIDGAMARMRDQITKWGKIYDPIADKLLVGMMVFIIVLKYIDFWTAIIIILLEFIIISVAWYRLNKGYKVQANVWGKIKMILQTAGVTILLLSVAFNLADLLPLASTTLYLAIAFAVVSILTYGI
ncbi:MAG: CDP-alcohol phosphatidyltransferase family protein [Patescibacteria group bacterium]|nr:CDP-alcohol phosphatidyltransferase family protein [Patescibacteria group bacterium]